MFKLITAAVTTASLALINVSAAQAATQLRDVINPNPTFPTQDEQNSKVYQSSHEMELAAAYCEWVIYSNGVYEEFCYYY